MRIGNLIPVLILCLSTGLVNADRFEYSKTYVLGDSLYDSGNIMRLKFTNRIGPDYNNSPFGPVTPELFAQGLGMSSPLPSSLGGTNFAVGGNNSYQIADSVTAPGIYLGGGTYNFPFMSLFASRGVYFGNRLDANAIYFVDGGGNDILQDLIADADDVLRSAGNMIYGTAGALSAAGARYIVIGNLPDVGKTPSANAGGNSALASFAADGINQAMLFQASSSTQNIVLLDNFGLIQEIFAAPAAFGFTLSASDLQTSCFSAAAACTTTVGGEINDTNPNPGRFFFNDPVHGTTAANEIFADYALSVFQGAHQYGLLSEMALDDVQAHQAGAKSVMRANRWHNATGVGKWTIYGSAQHNDQQRQDAAKAKGNNKADHLTLGFNYRLSDNWYAGMLLGRGDNKQTFDDSSASLKMTSYGYTGLLGYRSNWFFVEGLLGFNSFDYDKLERNFSLGNYHQRTESGSTKGNAMSFSVMGGLDVFGGRTIFRLGPLLGYESIDLQVSGFAEDGRRTTGLVVADQNNSSEVIMAGAFADLSLSFVQLYAEALYRDQQKDELQEVGLEIATQRGNRFYLPGYQRVDRWTLDLGANFRIGQSFFIDVNAGTASKSGNSKWLGVTLGAEI